MLSHTDVPSGSWNSPFELLDVTMHTSEVAEGVLLWERIPRPRPKNPAIRAVSLRRRSRVESLISLADRASHSL